DMNDKTFYARGVMAGMCIGIGGTIYLKVGGVAGAILFAIGLISVVSMKMNLFTGKAQFVWGVSRRNQTSQGGYLWLLAILALNILGCLALSLLIGADDLHEAALAIIDRRLEATPLRNGLRAVGCGFLMTLAVQGATKGKWLPLLFGVPAFILCGFPHCIADAYYITLLPIDYLGERGAEIALFYAAIVVGNFTGCNAYRAIEPAQEKILELTPSIGR
nr:formate/nitrite transporter family protein [Muribaculaceae bacterium]